MPNDLTSRTDAVNAASERPTADRALRLAIDCLHAEARAAARRGDVGACTRLNTLAIHATSTYSMYLRELPVSARRSKKGA